MSYRTIKNLQEVLEKHRIWLNGDSGGIRADLQGADLREADLREANLDYSCWPLWCGSLGAKVDKRIAAQLAYHFCRLNCEDPEYIAARNAIVGFANQFHRVEECGWLGKTEGETNAFVERHHREEAEAALAEKGEENA